MTQIKLCRTAIELQQPCNAGCQCSNAYEPVCLRATDTVFYSACYAGCTEHGGHKKVHDISRYARS